MPKGMGYGMSQKAVMKGMGNMSSSMRAVDGGMGKRKKSMGMKRIKNKMY